MPTVKMIRERPLTRLGHDSAPARHMRGVCSLERLPYMSLTKR